MAAAAVATAAGASGRPTAVPDASPQPLFTAVDEPKAFRGNEAALAFERTAGAGATFACLTLRWRNVAPAEPPADEAADPEWAGYDWSGFDPQVRLAVRNGLQPIVVIQDSPTWAQAAAPDDASVGQWAINFGFRDFWRPSAAALAAFVTAAAERYGGGVEGLPRVRYWQVWNEPNLSTFLNPQLRDQLTTRPSLPFNPADVVSADLYRGLTNAVYAAIHGVHPDNVVIAGGTSPSAGVSGVVALGPLLFMRKLLCMSDAPNPKPTCRTAVHFDVWSTHPYTSGGPTHPPDLPDDVPIAALPKMTTLLDAAVAAGHVLSDGPVRIWVTEFGWDTTPPDCCAVPLQLHARWVAEALYRMWQAGVSLVAWFDLRDQVSRGRDLDGQTLQSGLYFRGATLAQDTPKPALAAFRFPFVAFREQGKIAVWGRTPRGKPGSVVVEQGANSAWTPIGTLQTDRAGIFEATLEGTGGPYVRARLVGRAPAYTALPFSLKVPPDRHVNPFGGP